MRNFSGILKILCMILVVAFTGCANTPKEITASNFLKEIKITKIDGELFSGVYLGRELNCFPPVDKRVCVLRNGDGNLYEKNNKLDMEILELSSHSDENGLKIESADEFMLLLAATVALDRGFPMFTPLQRKLVSNCSTSENTVVHGRTNSMGSFGVYSGRVSTHETKSCINTNTSRFLLFKEKKLLADGVFLESKIKPGFIYPLLPLYFSENSKIELPKEIITPQYISIESWPYEGWKTHYESDDVSKALGSKYGINAGINFKLNFEKKKEEPLIEKLKKN